MGGDPPAPAATESTAQMLEAYTKAFPDLMRITNEGIGPAAEAQLKASQATSPAMAALQSQLYSAYGPLLAKTANEIAADQAMAQTKSDLNVMSGPGQQLVEKARELQRAEDPEFYKTRELLSGGLDRLVRSADLSGSLTPGEREELTRSINRDNLNRGISGNPSQTAVVENALTFGNAGYNRKLQGQNALTQALNVGNSFLPSSRTGVDVFQVATGRSSMPNAGDSKFTGVDTSLGQNASNMGNNLLGQVGGLVQQQNQINANRRDSLDRFNESWSSVVGSL